MTDLFWALNIFIIKVRTLMAFNFIETEEKFYGLEYIKWDNGIFLNMGQ